MENVNVSLPNQQALLNAPKNQEKTVYVSRPGAVTQKKTPEEVKVEEREKMEQAAAWFRSISLGSFLYAVIYAFCMYRNTEGITVPFCVGATLYFFWYYAKKFCGTVRKCDVFLMVSVLLLGIITCTTDSDVIIWFNKIALMVLVCIYLLELFYDVNGWSFMAFVKAACYTVFGGIGQMVMPFTDGVAFYKSSKEKIGKMPMEESKKQKISAIAIGIVIALPMLLFIIMLLSSADLYFSDLFGRFFDAVFSYELLELFRQRVFGIVGTIVFMFLLSYGTITYLTHKNSIREVTEEKIKLWNSYIAITFTSLIAVVYVLFAAIQIFGLFMGALELPEGYTYASYARQGFFQLAFVCFFNICLVLICRACFEEHAVLKGMLLLLCACTYIMLLSSAYRMILYVKVYQLTFLRLFVLWALVVMAVVMAGIVIFIMKKSFPIFRVMLVSITAFYIGFAAAHPDYWIASYNIAQAKEGEEIDEFHLLFNLSLDAAVPILEYYEYDIENPEVFYNEYFEEWELTLECERLKNYLNRIEQEAEDMTPRSFNISRAVAALQIEKYMGDDLNSIELFAQKYNHRK